MWRWRQRSELCCPNQGTPGAIRRGKRRGKILPQNIWKEHGSADILILNFWPLELWENQFLLFFFLYKFIYLFLAALGLHCCMRAFSSCSERGPLFVAVRGLLIAVASLVVEYGLQARVGLSSCGVWAPGHVGFSSCGSRSLERRLSSCGAWA